MPKICKNKKREDSDQHDNAKRTNGFNWSKIRETLGDWVWS